MRRSERYCLFAMAVIYAGPIVVMTLWASSAHSVRSVVTVPLTALLLACLIASVTRTWRIFFLVQLPLWLLSVAYTAYTLIFGFPPGHTLAGIVAATTVEELRGYFVLTQAKWALVFLLAGTVCYLLLSLRAPRESIFARQKSGLSRATIYLLLPVAAYAVLNPAELIDGISYDPAIGSLMFLAGDLPEANKQYRGSRVHKIPYGARRFGGEEVHILVVGESVRRDSWSVYGYGRRTTPFLNTLTDDVIFLQDATADANLTDWSVPIILTGITPEGFSIDNVRGNLLDLAKEAGYRTAWLVNQDIDISTAIGIDADRLVFPPDFHANINGRHTQDGELLPAYREEIARAGAARFIGIHMMGSHWEYYRRYPAAFQQFGAARELTRLSMLSVLLDDKSAQSAIVDAYDNNTLYTDWFLHQIIEQARTLTVPVTVTFFPDHGEDLQLFDGEVGHGQPTYTQHAFEIPAFVWVSDAYRKSHPDKVAALRENAKRAIRSHNVFYTVADLMGITWPGVDAKRSFASDSFVADTTMKYAAGGVLVQRPQRETAAAGRQTSRSLE
jgi:glucan phosphoethanolaminetransferase (alkaline phosphatase superfamily)